MDRARALQNCERALQIAQDALGAQMGLWADAEKTQIRALSGRAFGERDCNIIRPQESAFASIEATADVIKTKVTTLFSLCVCKCVIVCVIVCVWIYYSIETRLIIAIIWVFGSINRSV